jgi:hypothetical protein
MRITKQFLRLSKEEVKDIAGYCLDILTAPIKPREEGTIEVRVRSLVAERTRNDKIDLIKKLLIGLTHHNDLYADRFLGVAQLHKEYAELFGIKAPR